MIGVICMPSTNHKHLRPNNYINWLESGGGHCLEIPYYANPVPYLQNCKGVVWIGGAIENKKYEDYRDSYMKTLEKYTFFQVQTRCDGSMVEQLVLNP